MAEILTEGASAGLRITPNKSYAEKAAEALRELIILEQLAPGAPISERELTRALGISRTPLREALRTLELQGLIEYSATRRPFVANPSLIELSELISVLAALEALAGELACKTADEAMIRSIVALEEQMHAESESVSALDFFRTDMEFHAQIVLASGNGALIETHRDYNARLWRARFISSRREERRERTLAEHHDIVHALSNRKSGAVAKALRRHLNSTIQNIADARSVDEAQI